MNNTLKIAVGILISAVLFYFFIRDVNNVKLTMDAGPGVRENGDDRILNIGDVSGLEAGDEIRICDRKDTVGISGVIEKIIVHPGNANHEIYLAEPLPRKISLEDKPYIKFPRLQRALKTANYWWLLPSWLLTMVALWIRSYRWKFFFPNRKTIRMNSLWAAVCIGYMANNVLPFRMGEIIRAWILGRKENRSISETFATIVMERVFDILTILILFVGFIFYFEYRGDVVLPSWLTKGAWILTAVSVISLLFLLALKFKTPYALEFIRFIIKPLPDRFRSPIMRLIESFVQGLSILSSFYAAFMGFILSMVIWLNLAIVYYLQFKAVDIDASLLVAMFLIVGLAFAVSIPSAPGFIGTFHLIGKEVLHIVGVTGNIEAYVLLAHAMAYLPLIILGLIYLSLENLSLRDLRKKIGPHTEL
jgi:glycosyltransferase 2 family protein